MTIDENKEVVRCFYDAMNAKDPKVAATFSADESINHGRKVERKTMELLLESAVQVHDHSEVHQMVAEGD